MTLPRHLRRNIAPGTEVFQIPDDFWLECGERLTDVEIAYRTWGDIRERGQQCDPRMPRTDRIGRCRGVVAENYWPGQGV